MNSYLLKPSEDNSLLSCLLTLESENLQWPLYFLLNIRVPQSYLIKLFGELFTDIDRSSVSKDENQLHQTLVMFLQQHQDVSLHNVLLADDAEPTKKLAEYSQFTIVFNQCLSNTNASNDLALNADGKEMIKNPVASGDVGWLNQARTYQHDHNYSIVPPKTRNSHPGKPTVLTTDEELILTNFILHLEERQVRIPREDVGKLVMGLMRVLGRQHPFKDDGPHRHWFNGFFRRNPNIMKSRQSSAPAPREQLKEEQIEQFLSEIKRLDSLDMISVAARNLHRARLDETGYHIDVSQDGIPSFMQQSSSQIIAPSLMMMDAKEKKKATWTTEQLAWAVEEVSSGRATMKDVSERVGIPIATIRNHCRNPQMGARRGPPTVLTPTEELALERFLIHLDDCGYKANRDDLAKLVMRLVNTDKRPHPFKEDGPHRHWFDVGSKMGGHS